MEYRFWAFKTSAIKNVINMKDLLYIGTYAENDNKTLINSTLQSNEIQINKLA